MREARKAKKLWKVILRNDPETRTAAKEALVAMGAPAVPSLVRVLAEPDQRFAGGTSRHARAYRILDLIGEGAIEPLEALSQTPDPAVSRTASELLCQLSAGKSLLMLAKGSAAGRDQLVDKLRNGIKTGTGHQILQSANTLAVSEDGDMTAGLIIGRLKSRNLFEDKLILVGALVSLAKEGTTRARDHLASTEWNLHYLMRTDWVLPSWTREGRIHPSLREEINKSSRLAGLGISLSPTATVSPSSVIEDGRRRYDLRIAEDFVEQEHTGSVTQHRYDVYLLDDPEVASIQASIEDVLRGSQ